LFYATHASILTSDILIVTYITTSMTYGMFCYHKKQLALL